MADGTAAAQVPAPAPTPAPAPQVAPQAPTGSSAPPTEPGPSGGDAGLSGPEIAAAHMGDADPANFLRDFLENSSGLSVEQAAAQSVPTPTAPTVPAAPTAPQAPVHGNAAPTAPHVAPAPMTAVPPQGVNPAHLAALMAPAPVMPTAPPAPVPYPQNPAAWAAPGMPQQPAAPVQVQQPVAEAPKLFDAPVQLPAEILQGINADDPNVRAQAIGAMLAAYGNHVHQKTIEYTQQQIAPQVAQATYAQVNRQQVIDMQEREIYGRHPQLRYASPLLIQQAARVIVQDELSRNPGAQVTPDVMHRIADLAAAGVAQLAGGQVPQFQPPAPQAPVMAAPQVQYQQPQVMPQQAPPGYVWHPQYGWVMPAQQQMAPAGFPPPFISGNGSMPMGMPQVGGPSPNMDIGDLRQLVGL